MTGATGDFAFPILSVAVNTQYRVLMPRTHGRQPDRRARHDQQGDRHAKVLRGTKRGRIHFWGRLTPALDGATVQIQKLRRGDWVNIGQTSAKATSKGFSRYSKRISRSTAAATASSPSTPAASTRRA